MATDTTIDATTGTAPTLTRPRLVTPRAAAFAGIIFSLLMGGSVVLVYTTIPANPPFDAQWLAQDTRRVSLAVNLLPFAGIAFLWFMGVIRSQLGDLEDQILRDGLSGQWSALPGRDICLDVRHGIGPGQLRRGAGELGRQQLIYFRSRHDQNNGRRRDAAHGRRLYVLVRHDLVTHKNHAGVDRLAHFWSCCATTGWRTVVALAALGLSNLGLCHQPRSAAFRKPSADPCRERCNCFPR